MIEKHNKNIAEREQEIVIASAEETDEGRIVTSQIASKQSKISTGRNRPKVNESWVQYE